jgi:three-Cys-motif partner protein
MDAPLPPAELPHIKLVSRVKHTILQNYLPPWAAKLGSRSHGLNYFDCFAGPGRYNFSGEVVDGSPVIAVKAGKHFVSTRPNHTLAIILTEKDKQRAAALERELSTLEPYPPNLRVGVLPEDSNTFIPDLLQAISALAPSFFMIDPYGHPLKVPVINDILSRPKTEVFITLMWYRINMDLSNALVQHNIDALFGDKEWRQQPFVGQRGLKREEGFLEYFISRLNARYVLHFRIEYDPEDKNKGRERTKYYLLHASTNRHAVLLMKEIMAPLGDEQGTFGFSGGSKQGSLISRSPQLEDLKRILLSHFTGREVSFDDIRLETWKLPFVEKEYRKVLQELRAKGTVKVTAVSSKKAGLTGRDLVLFERISRSGNPSDQL